MGDGGNTHFRARMVTEPGASGAQALPGQFRKDTGTVPPGLLI